MIGISVTDVLSLMQEISLQPVIQKQLHPILTSAFLIENSIVTAGLIDSSTSSDTWKSLEDRLALDDPEGMQLLAVYMLAACMVRTRYRAAGVSESIFTDTMKCFPRYLQNEYDRTGKWAFTRGFWTWRHLSCQMFRLGVLEYEYVMLKPDALMPENMEAGDPVLYVHIPSDAKLSQEELQFSYNMAEKFFKGIGVTFCVAGAPKAMLCNTWLLSPMLQDLLHPFSGIRRFAEDYMVYASEPDDDSFYLWLYQGKKPPQELPLKTSLQRIVYDHLQKGGKIGAAHGCRKIWNVK